MIKKGLKGRDKTPIQQGSKRPHTHVLKLPTLMEDVISTYAFQLLVPSGARNSVKH